MGKFIYGPIRDMHYASDPMLALMLWAYIWPSMALLYSGFLPATIAGSIMLLLFPMAQCPYIFDIIKAPED